MYGWYNNVNPPWFEFRGDIKNIVIEDGVTSVSRMVFAECEALESVTIGKDVEDYGSYCFYNCFNLKSITVDKDNEYFYSDSCGVLYEVMYNGMMLLRQYPMGNERTSYTVPDNVQNICAESFRSAKNLKYVTISDTVRFVEYQAFKDCKSLESIVIPDSVETIGGEIFDGCENLKSVTIGSGVYKMYDDAFGYCEKLESINVDKDNQYFSSDSYGVLYNKDKTSLVKFPMACTQTLYSVPNGVKSIAEKAFYSCEKLESVDIPDSVTTIGTSAFLFCENLSSITMGKNVEEVGEQAFANTAYYYNYDNWEDGVLYIGNCAVDSNFSEYDFHLEIKDGTRTIADSAFNWNGIGSVDIPDSVMYIGTNAFYGNSPLSTITIGSNVRKIGQYAFSETEFSWNDSNWENGLLYIGDYLVDTDGSISGKVAVKDGTKLICDNAFEGRYDVAGIELPDSVKFLGDRAFMNCNSLKSVSLGSGITSLGDWVFYNCSQLESIVIPNSVKSIGNEVFYFCEDLKNVTIGSSVETIGDGAFHSCYELETINIPDSVRVIGSEAFYNCGLKTATIGIGVTTIGKEAFAYCNGLTIHGYAGSAAQKYANENWIDFVARTGTAYVVSYDANGGMGAPSSQIKEKGKTLTLSKTEPVRSGFTFKGWSTTPKGKVEYAPGATYKKNESVTLYAVWEGYVIPDEFVKYVEIQDGVMESLGLYVEAVDDRTLTATLSGIVIRDSYTANLSSSKRDDCEYEWSVRIFSDSDVSYEVSTACWAFNPGRNDLVTVDDMQHSVWVVNHGNGNLIGDADMSHTADSITWTFSIPQEYDFDFSETTKFVAVHYDVDDTYIERTYKVGEEEDLTLANAVSFTPLQSTSLAVGKTLSLSAKAYRLDGLKPKNANVVYEIVSGQEFATIDAKGKLTALATGEVVVRATAVTGTADAYAEITITVCIPATKVSLNMTNATMAIGLDELQLVATMTPANTDDTLTWSSSNEKIATVDENGVVTAHSTGKVKINAVTGSGKKASCSVTIGAPADAVEFSALKSTSLAVGKTLSFKAKAYCEDGSKPVNTAVTFEIVSGEDVATIDAKGKLTALATGEVVVRATAVTGTADAYAEITINVCIPITKIKFAQSTMTLTVGDVADCPVLTITPAYNTDTYTFYSSNENVVLVDENGTLTAVTKGTAKVYAQSGSGMKATLTVKVVD